MPRACVFVDGSNLYFALKRNNKMTRVDYYRLSLALVGDRHELIRTYYYNAVFDAAHFSDKAKSQQTFFDSLDRTPYLELRLGRVIQSREGHRIEKGVDVRLAADLVYYAARDLFDVAVVVTEDPDFVPAIEWAKELGKQVELAGFPDGQNREMVRAADKVLNLEEIINAHTSAIFPPSQPVDDKSHVDEEMAYGLHH